MRRRINPSDTFLSNSNKSSSTSALLSQKRALTTDEQNYIISSAENDILFNDQIAHHAFQFLILLEGFVFFFFSVADVRKYLQLSSDSNILREHSTSGLASLDTFFEAMSHFVVSVLAFAAAYMTFGKRSLKRNFSANKFVDQQKSESGSMQPKMQMMFDGQHLPKSSTLPPTPAFPPPPTAVGLPQSPPTMPMNPFETKLSDLKEMEVDDEIDDAITIVLNHSNIRKVQKTHRTVACLSLLIAAPLLFLSAKLSSTHESPYTASKLLLYWWQPLQHLLLAWATKALVEDVVGSIEQLKKTKYKHQDA